MKLLFIIAVSALLLVGAGCDAKTKQAAAPPSPEATAPPSPVGLPRVLKETFDEDDHLDAALQELDTVE